MVGISYWTGLLFPDDPAYSFQFEILRSGNLITHYFLGVFPFLASLFLGYLAIYHSDGKIDAILEDIIEIGFDGLNPIDPNALDIFQINKQVKGKLSILGNIDLEHTLPYGTPEEVDEAVLVHIRELAPGGGYCLSSANSIPDYVPFENYIAMRDACYKYGRYPIAV